MIKFDRDVHLAMKTLEKEGFESYAAGDCVKNSIAGIPVYDWDLITKASCEDLKRLFPSGMVIDKEKGILRIDYTYEVPGKDEEPSRVEGVILDITPFDGTVEEEMSRRAFTIDAMADNPERTFVDPYNGRADIKEKLVKTVTEPDALFKSEPIRMLSAVRLAAEMGFDLHKNVYEAILANWRVLLDYDVAPVREELERLLVSDHAGKGLSMMAGCGLMAVIFGEEVSSKMSSSDMQAFNTLCENIDKTKPVRTRRLGLLYSIFSKKRGLAAIAHLDFDPKTKQHLDDSMNEIIDIQFLTDTKIFKRYLYEHGLERYNYLHNLSKALRIVYDHPATKIESRNYMMKVVRSNHEPVFLEDLVIDANDILEAGITDSPEKAEELLGQVIAVVHTDPKNNNRETLLQTAKKYSKNKFAAKTRYVKWMK